MKKTIAMSLMLVIATAFAGCAKKQTITKEEGTVSKSAEAQDSGKEGVEAAAGSGKDSPAVKELSRKEKVAKWRDEFRFENVYFDYDSYDVKDKNRKILNGIADWLTGNREAVVQIEGHCDERGTVDYNIALGERRANSVRQYLIAKGVSPAQLSTMTYGKEKPVCYESGESCWWKNRKAAFTIMD